MVQSLVSNTLQPQGLHQPSMVYKRSVCSSTVKGREKLALALAAMVMVVCQICSTKTKPSGFC